ncbi:MAG: carbon-nitrogen hydrolase family protein [Rickettsiales bacterium]
MKLIVATSQFPVSADIARNYEFIAKHVRSAKAQGADIVHFPECALSGYAGTDFTSHKAFDWHAHEAYARQLLVLARQHKIWMVVGSAHRLGGKHKPHNSLYIINDKGALVERYDKRFCAGNAKENTGDLKHYSPGDHFSTFTVKGIRCGALICHDYRYPELYRAYKKLGVQMMFHSYHAGGASLATYRQIQKNILPFAKLNEGATYPAITMPATMRSYAANNYVWISCPNSSAKESCWPAFFVRPDGVITGRLKRNVAGLLISVVDSSHQWYDSTVAWRDRAIDGVLHSGTLVSDARSSLRTAL